MAALRCPQCGREAEAGLFCTHCGIRLVEAVPAALPALFCSSCGRALSGGERFCATCGAAVAQGAFTAAAAVDRPGGAAAGPTAARWWWLAAAGLLVVGVVVGVILAARSGEKTAVGSATPEEAVRALVTAVEAGDPLGALAMLAPNERKLLADVYSTALEAAQDEGLLPGEEAALEALDLDISLGELSVAELTDHSAWVSAPAATVQGGLHPERWQGTPLAEFHLDSYTLEGLAAWSYQAEGWSQYDYSMRGYREWLSEPGVAVVEEGGRWYVSALYTGAELTRRYLGLPMIPGEYPELPGGVCGTPEEAVATVLSALADKDLRRTAACLVPEERRFVIDYEPSLGAYGVGELADIGMSLEVGDLSVVESSRDRAVVEAPQWQLRWSGYPGYGSVAWNGQAYCASWEGYGGQWESDCLYTDAANYDYGHSYVDGLALLADQGWRGLRLVAVPSEGGWAVSLVESVRYTLLPAAGEPAYALLWFFGVGDVGANLAWTAAAQAPVLGSDGSVEAMLAAAGRAGLARASFGSPRTAVMAMPDAGTTACALTIWRPGGNQYEWGEAVADALCGEYTDPLPPGEYLLWVTTASGWWGPGVGPVPLDEVTLTARSSG